MRRILIIGAGQAGLQLALTLLGHGGYDVTVMTAQTPEEIRGGRITSTQCMFFPALEIEREAGLNHWEEPAPWIEGQRVTLAGPGGRKLLETYGIWDAPAQSVDQRVKMPGWLERVEKAGGRVVLHPVVTSDLEALSRMYDLTLIAAGKGALVELFDRDASRSPYDAPQRNLAAIYVRGVRPYPSHPTPHVRINAVPGVGETYLMPALTTSGVCDAVLVEAVPGGPFDVFGDRRVSPDEHLRRIRALYAEWMPWEHELYAEAEPTDEFSTLYGGYAPVVRHPVGTVGDRHVLGMGDVVVLNDPGCGQGANNAAHCASIYHRAIVEHGDRPFTPEWMRQTFERYWEYSRWATALTNTMIGPLPEHVQQILGVASMDDETARRFARGYAVPPSLADWFFDAEKAGAYLATRTPQPAE